MAEATLKKLDGPRGALAYRLTPGAGPCVVWLCGFGSDMSGTKATALEAWAQTNGRAFLRFDYSGCGLSDGTFEDGVVSAWLEDTFSVLDSLRIEDYVLVGSSMGGWIALLVARARPALTRGLMLIAPAPDFTQRLLEPELPAAARQALQETGRWDRPSAYGPPQPITQALIEDGRAHHVLTGSIPFHGPVRIVHGQQDPDVPWRLSLELAERIESANVETLFIKSGDHRLSTPQDIALLERTLTALLALLSPAPPATS